MRRRYRWLLILLVVMGAPYYWMLLDNRPGGAPAQSFDIAELRRLAEAMPGPKPERVVLEQVAWRRLPGVLMVAGGGLKRRLISINSYLLTGPRGDIVIDAGLGAADARAMGLERFLPDAQARVDAAMRRARLVVFTHEHLDHINGLLRLPDFAAVAPRALIPPEQGPAGALAGGLPWPKGAAEVVEPFRYRGMTAVAPGVVLIRTPGHTPGSQMIYTRLASGREYLFAGDTATMARSWRETRARSRLIGDWVAPEDRGAVFGWLKAIRDLKRREPALVVVAGHEYDDFRFSGENHGIRLGFAAQEPLAPPPTR